MWLYHRVKSPNNADGMANSVDPDQTAPLASRSSLIWICTVCPGISVRKLRIITVSLIPFVQGMVVWNKDAGYVTFSAGCFVHTYLDSNTPCLYSQW